MPKRRDENAPYWQQMRLAQRNIIEYALEHGKTVRGTAVLLGISSNYLSEEMRALGIPIPDVKPGPKPGTKPNRPPKPNLRVVSDSAEVERTDAADEEETEEEETDTDLEEEPVSEDGGDEEDEDEDDWEEEDWEDGDEEDDLNDAEDEDAASGN